MPLAPAIKNSCRLPLALVAGWAVFQSGLLENVATLNKTMWLSLGSAGSIVQNAESPGSGLEVLPPEVASAIELLKRNGASTYRMSDALAKSAEFQQRLIEGGWPLRPEHEAKALVLMASEADPDACRQKDANGAVKLDLCD